MVEAVSFNQNYLNSDYNVGDYFTNPLNEDKSIFDAGTENTPANEENVAALMAELQAVEDKQGAIQDGLNSVKGALGVGTSSKKCDETIEKYKNGEITYEEAMAEIEKFENKQESGLNLTANVAVSVLSIVAAAAVGAAITAATGGTGAPAAAVIAAKIAAGAGVGALTKAGVKTIDRATNDVEGDDFDGKQIARDALSGAVTGGLASATMGNGKAADSVAEAVKINAVKSAKTGAVTGAISGSANYGIDCAFDEDKDFTAAGLAEATLSNAAASAAVGGIMGTANGVLKTTGVVTHGGANATEIRDVAANAGNSAMYKVVRKVVDDIPDIAA